jgi:hypothetical protein
VIEVAESQAQGHACKGRIEHGDVFAINLPQIYMLHQFFLRLTEIREAASKTRAPSFLTETQAAC